MSAGSSPPCACLGELLVDGAAAEAKNNGGGGELGLGLPAHEGLEARAWGSRVGRPGAAAALNSPGRTPWREGHAEDAFSGRTRTAAAQSSPGRGRAR
jgi:hypothetical protein